MIFAARIIALILPIFGLALPATSQTATELAEEIIETMEMRVAPAGQAFRAIAPLPDGRFVAASYTREGATWHAALHVVDETGAISGAIQIPTPPGNWKLGNRIDGLVPVGDAIIGMGALTSSEDRAIGWVIRIEQDMTISRSIALPLAAQDRTLNYYYNAVADGPDRLVLAGRADRTAFFGLGIGFDVTSGRPPEIRQVNPGSGAADAGLQPGDLMIRANGAALEGMTAQQVAQALAGTENESIALEYRRDRVRVANVARKKVKGPASAVVAVIDPATMNLVVSPKLLMTSDLRAGFQDIGRSADGRLFGVGWAEKTDSKSKTYDQIWIASLDKKLNPTTHRFIGPEDGNSIARGIVRMADGRSVVLGGRHAGPEPQAFASALDIQAENVRLTDVNVFHLGPGRSDSYRVGVTLGTGGTLVGGSFRSDPAPDFQAFVTVLEGNSPPHRIFASCTRAYVFDMARNEGDAVAIAGYCREASGTSRAAIMYAPASRQVAEKPSFANAQSVQLTPDTGGGLGSFELEAKAGILIFAPRGASGVLSLSDAAGNLVDYLGVDKTRAGLLEAELPEGRYKIEWAADGPSEVPLISVLKRAAQGGGEQLPVEARLSPFAREAMQLLGYSSAQYEGGSGTDPQSFALVRDITAFQLSHRLPPLGYADFATEVALLRDGALEAEKRANVAVAAAEKAAQSAGAVTLFGEGGLVRGSWRGDLFVGVMRDGTMSYIGEFRLTDFNELQPYGYGKFEDSAQGFSYAGQRPAGNLSVLGVMETRGDAIHRKIGLFDENGNLGIGAVMANGQTAETGQFAKDGALVRSVSLP